MRSALLICLAAWFAIACGEQSAEREVFVLRADADAPAGDTLRCFVHEGIDAIVTGLEARIDPQLVHHASVHLAPSAPDAESCTLPAGSRLLYVWSPGDDALTLPDDAALTLRAADGVLVLELHYVNLRGEPAPDASGIALHLAREPRAREVGIWIAGVPVLAIPPRARAHVEERACRVRAADGVLLHAVSPHMHARGVAMQLILERDGAQTALVDLDPFDPDRQRTQRVEPAVELLAGDVLLTRCTYDNPSDHEVHYGTSLDDEMCFAYLWASPIDALRADASFCH